MRIGSPASLSDAQLVARVKHLVRYESHATAELVAHLAEFDKRQLYLGAGCRSLFTYCVQVLHLSEHAAYNRIEAARIARRFPVVLVRLARGDVHLTAVQMLASILTPENHRELLDAAKHKSKREIEELVARLRPRPDVPDAVRRVATPKHPQVQGSEPELVLAAVAQGAAVGQASNGAVATQGTADARSAAATPTRPAVVVPLAPERYKVQFTASAAIYRNLRRAQGLLRHQIPDGDLAAVMGRALELLVRDLEKKKIAATDRPRAGKQTAEGHSRHIPAAVKRAVWQRDQGRCSFVSPSGKRCTEEDQIEFDHARPHGDGGSATVANVRLLCARHNQHQAREFFGPWNAEGVRELQLPYGDLLGYFTRSRTSSLSPAAGGDGLGLWRS